MKIFLQQYKKHRVIVEPETPIEFSFDLPFYHEIAGVRSNAEDFGENDFGITTATVIDELKNYERDQQYNSSPDTNKIVPNTLEIETPYGVAEVGYDWHDLDNEFSFAGDFTLLFEWKPTASIISNSGHVFSGFDGVNVFVLSIQNGGATMSVNTGGAYKLVTLSSAIQRYHWYKVAVRRTGSVVDIRINDGEITGPNTGYNTDPISVGTIFCNIGHDSNRYVGGYYRRLGIAQGAITNAQINEFFDALKNEDVTWDAPTTPNLSGLSWTNVPANGYISKDVHLIAVGNCRHGFRHIGRGNYIFSAIHDKEQDGINMNIFTFDYVNWKYNIKTLTRRTASTDVHINGSIADINNRLHYYDNDKWYDSPSSRLWISRSEANYDVSSFSDLNMFKGVAQSPFRGWGYTGIHKFSDGTIIICGQQHRTATTEGFLCAVSTDGGNHWTQYKLLDLIDGANALWPYPSYIYNYDRDEVMLIINVFDSTQNKFIRSYFFRTTDGYTWKNLSGSYSKDVRHGSRDDIALSNHITDTLAQANCLLKDGSAGSDKNVRCPHAVYDNGVIYGICGDGNGGWEYFELTIGGAASFQAITFPTYTVPGSGNGYMEGGFLDIGTGNNRTLYMLADYLGTGNMQVCQWDTTDKFVTTTFGARLTTNAGFHQYLMGICNPFESGNKILLSGLIQADAGETFNYYSTPWVYKI